MTLMFIIQGIPVLPKDMGTYILLLCISMCGCVGQTTLVKGAQLIEASKTAVLRNADIGFVLLWQVIFLHLFPTFWSMLGLALITACTIIAAVTRSPPSESLSEEVIEDLSIVASISTDTWKKLETNKGTEVEIELDTISS